MIRERSRLLKILCCGLLSCGLPAIGAGLFAEEAVAEEAEPQARVILSRLLPGSIAKISVFPSGPWRWSRFSVSFPRSFC